MASQLAAHGMRVRVLTIELDVNLTDILEKMRRNFLGELDWHICCCYCVQ